MDDRLDPLCAPARALHERHETQRANLVGHAGSGGRLASVLDAQHERAIDAHRAACPRCARHEPRCAACGFDLRRERHGWRCPANPARAADWWPWNWRARHAAAHPPARPVATPRAQAATAPPPPRPTRPATTTAAPQNSPLVQAYRTLGLSPHAPDTQVRAAYRERALRYHPDKVAHLAPEFRLVADAKMKEINAAYEAIRGARGMVR